jgi:hypothetical protein
MPMTTSHLRSLLLTILIGVASAVSARMPPSPRLSARRTKTPYLTEMMRISAQKIRDITPKTFSGVAAMA